MNKLIATFFISILITAGSVAAQGGEDNIRNVYFDTMVTRDIRSIPIGVDEMKYIGTDYISKADTTLMRYITAVVQYDVDFYADFELILIDSFYIKTYEIEELNPLGWMRLGADYMVRLEAEFPGRNVRIRWRLFDNSRNKQFAKGTIEKSKKEWRTLGHIISNEIVKNVTGEDGIFLTKIAFAKVVTGNKEIFLADYDGSNEIQLTNNGSINISPTFSPDGKYIYFTSFMHGEAQLYQIELKNNKIKRLGNFKGIVAAPAVSPDGSMIAVVLTKDGNSEIYLLDKKGRVIRRLTRHRSIDTSPTWSPDGKSIAFSSDRSGKPQLYIMQSDGTGLRRLTYEGRYNDSPIWSQKADRITFVSRTKSGRFDLASIDTSGTDYRVMTTYGMNENPHFSPDGKHIIFSSNRLGPKELFTMDISGRNQRRLTRNGNSSNPVWGPLKLDN